MSGSAVSALARRDLSLARSYRLSLGFDVAWGVIDLLVYFFISKLVTTGVEDLGSAPSYFSFAVTGIVMSLVIYATSTGVAYRVRDEQLTGTLEVLCAQPLRAVDLALGVISFPLGFAVVRAAAYLAIAALALDLDAPDADWAGVLVMLVTAGMAFAPIGILAAAATIVFKRAMSIAGAIIFAMTFVSGALFPVSVLPEWLQKIGHADADLVCVRGPPQAPCSRGKAGRGDALALVAFAVVALPCTVWLLAAAIAHAKRQGTLGQY